MSLRFFLFYLITLTAPAVASIAPSPLVARDDIAATVSFGYDNNGNLSAKNTSAGNLTLAWDESNQLKTAAISGISQSYAYDSMGRRIRKTHAGAATNYLYNGDDIHAEYAAWSAPTVLYTQGGGVDDHLARLPLTGP